MVLWPGNTAIRRSITLAIVLILPTTSVENLLKSMKGLPVSLVVTGLILQTLFTGALKFHKIDITCGWGEICKMLANVKKA